MGGRCAREGERSVREEDSRRWAASRGVDWGGSVQIGQLGHYGGLLRH